MRLAVIALFFPAALPAASIIPQGSHALLRLVNSISTKTAREGDFVYMKTATPIVSAGEVVVPVDSYVQGVVTHSRRGGRVTGRAELSVRIETLTLPGGKQIRVSPHLASVDPGESGQKVATQENQIQQEPGKAADAGRIATTSGAGAAIGGLADRSWTGAGIGAGAGAGVGLATVLLTRGREIELRQGSTIDVIFERAVPVD